MTDPGQGWEAVAYRFATIRSDVGADVVRRWAVDLPAGGSVVDIGCGTGRPIALAQAGAGLAVSGIDPSPTLLAAFRRALPHAPAACETAEDSGYFGRRFDGAVAIGLLFLLPPATQAVVIGRVARALLDQAGLRLTGSCDDAGGNHYFAAVGQGRADGPDRPVPIAERKKRDPGSSPG